MSATFFPGMFRRTRPAGSVGDGAPGGRASFRSLAFCFFCFLHCAVFVFVSPTASAQQTYGWVVADGNWTGNNWDQLLSPFENNVGPPSGDEETASIDNGGVATVSSSTQPFGTLIVGNTNSFSDTTALWVLSTTDPPGAGFLVVGTEVIIGNEANVSATVRISGAGANLSFGGGFLLGNNGQGHMRLENGGTVASTETAAGYNLQLGSGANSSGTLTIEGGVVQILSPGSPPPSTFVGIVVGGEGTGSLTITNSTVGETTYTGEVDVPNLLVGQESGSTGTVEMVSGTMQLSESLQIGASGTGTVTISGGTVNIDSASGEISLGIEAASQGTLNIGGTGVVNATNVQVGTAGSASLNLTGGALNISNVLEVGPSSSPNTTVQASVLVSGGTLTTAGLNINGQTNNPGFAAVEFTLAGSGLLDLSVDNTTHPIFLNSSLSSEFPVLNFGTGGTVGSVSGISEIKGQGVGAGQINFNHTGDFTLGAPLNGNLVVNKFGSGTSVLDGISNASDTHEINVNVSEGTFLINGQIGSSSPSGTELSVSDGATLAGAGVFFGTATLENGAIVSPGQDASISTLTIQGDTVFTGDITFSYHLGANNESDLLLVNSLLDFGAFTSQFVFDFNNTGQFGEFTLLEALEFSSVNFTQFQFLNLALHPNLTPEFRIRDTTHGKALVFSLVPEPGTSLLIFLGFGYLYLRRRFLRQGNSPALSGGR